VFVVGVGWGRGVGVGGGVGGGGGFIISYIIKLCEFKYKVPC